MYGSESADLLGEELFIQDRVLVNKVVPSCDGVDFEHNLGTLSVALYPFGKCIEWRQSEVTVETEEDHEWAVVQEATNGRSRSKNGSYGALGPPIIKFKVSQLKSFRVSRDNHKITLLHIDGVSSCCFSFQRGSSFFVNYLKSIVQTSQSRKDPKLHLVMDQPEVQNLKKSFSQLELFPESRADVIWTFVQKLHNRPLETTMDAFSKVTDVLLHKPLDDREIAERLSRSLQCDDLTSRNAIEYEVIAPKFSLPPMCLPARGEHVTQIEIDKFYDELGRIPQYELLKTAIFNRGVSASAQPEVWRFLLEYYPWNSTTEERAAIDKLKSADYYRMKQQWQTMSKNQEDRFADYKERKSLIEKDVARTDRTHWYFADDDNPHLNTLQDILMTYVMFNFDLGYVQGMSDLLSPLLLLLQDEVETFWCFTSLINRMVKNFDVDQAGMKEQLQQLYILLGVVEPSLASYLALHESSNMFFCFRWLLVWFKREFSFADIYTLWETMLAESRCPNYHLLICLAILDTEKNSLIGNEYGFTEILKHINDLSYKIDLDLTLRKAEAIYLQLIGIADLPNNVREILGMPLLPEPKEEVIDQDEKTPMASSILGGGITYTAETEEIAFENSLSMFL